MTDLIERLRGLYEGHPPFGAAHEAANEIEAMRQQVKKVESDNTTLRNKIKQSERYKLREQLAACEKDAERLRQICRDAYEVWAGSEGISIPETAPEAYLLRLVEQMRDEVKKGM